MWVGECLFSCSIPQAWWFFDYLNGMGTEEQDLGRRIERIIAAGTLRERFVAFSCQYLL